MFDEPKLNRHNAPRKRRVASIAQSVEQGIENPRVGGSIPPRGTIFSSLVQSVERWTVNPYVAGASPAGGAILIALMKNFIRVFLFMKEKFLFLSFFKEILLFL